MTDFQKKKAEWSRFFKVASSSYKINALLSVLENDGPQMLAAVLKDAGLEASLDLLKAMDNKPQTYE